MHKLTDTHRGSAEDGRERVVYKVDVVEWQRLREKDRRWEKRGGAIVK